MACAHGSSDSDKNIGPPNKLGSSGKRFISSSEDDNGTGKFSQQNLASSSANRNGVPSERRQSLRKKRKFKMPSREKQWDSIPSDCKVSNKLSRLTPRKLVNDFTRVTHRYNYDYVELSGEESMEEFIKNTDSSSSTDTSTSTSDQHCTHKKRHRVKGYRPRIARLSDDSSEEDELNSSTAKIKEETDLRNVSTSGVDTCKNTKKTFMQRGDQTTQSEQCNEEEDCDLNDDDIQPGSSSKTRRKSVLNSDSDEASQHSSSEDSLKTCKKSKRTNTLNSDSDNDVQSNNEESNGVHSPSKQSRSKSILMSDSDSSDKDTVDKQTCVNTTDEGASTSKEADYSTNKDQDKNLLNNKECDKRSARKDSRDSVIEIDDCSSEDESDGSNTDNSEASSVTDNDRDSAITDEDNNEEFSDAEENVGWIQKLAERKRQKRDSMFDELKTLREKRQKKS